MSKRVIKILQENGIDCLPNERFSLDVEMFPENEKELAFPATALFEKPELKNGKNTVEEHRTFGVRNLWGEPLGSDSVIFQIFFFLNTEYFLYLNLLCYFLKMNPYFIRSISSK